MTLYPLNVCDSGIKPCVFEARALVKDYDDGRVQALRGVNFHIHQGEFVAITGPSGCGKTTLLQMLGALDLPSSGSLRFQDRPMTDLPDLSTFRARDVGIVFQSFHLLPTFTALENVQLPMFETDATAAERKDRAQMLLKSVGMGHRQQHFPAKLSGGERQRVAIARSLANGPAVLLADEPTGNLDSENAAVVMDLLIQLYHEHQMTLILITHDMSLAQRATRIIQMKDGRVVADNPVQTTPSPATS